MNTAVKYTGTALPLSGATVVLFSTVTAFQMANGIQMGGIARLVVDLRVDGAAHLGGTFKWYKSEDRGTNWLFVDSQVVSGDGSTTPSQRLDLLIQAYRDFKLEFVMAAENSTEFNIDMALTTQRSAA